jgi:hypothetical protein
VKSIVDVGNDESKLEALKTLKIDYVKGNFARAQERQIY